MMSTETTAQQPAEAPQSGPSPPIWLQASVDDVKAVDFNAPIAASTASEANDLGEEFRKAAEAGAKDGAAADDANVRVFSMLHAVMGMYFKPEQRNEPFGPMFVLADGRSSPAPENFRGSPIEVLAYIAERTNNPVLRARLSDVCWLLERKRGQLGTLALSSYLEIVQKINSGDLKLRFEKEADALHHEVRDLLRRALQIGRGIGWDKPETIRARVLVNDLRKRANSRGAPIPVHWFSELDLDFAVSDPGEVAAGIDDVLKSLIESGSHETIDLWRLAARAYHLAKKDDDAHRCQSEAAERLVAEAEAALSKQNSAMLASHSLSAAIAELHGIPGKKDRRTELRHHLIDVQARIPEELSIFSQEMDLRGIAQTVEKSFHDGGFLEKMLRFAALANSPDPNHLVKQAADLIQKHPFASLFGASHLDREGKVVHRTPGGIFGDGADDPAIQQQIAQGESIRRKLVASAEIDVARRAINEQHYASEEIFGWLLQYSPFVPRDLLATFARGFARFFQGDFVSATYILTPLLENSLRHVLKGHGHDVTIFDDATQTQQDRTISSLFEQMRAELDAVFTKAITTDIENVFLKKPGPNLRHAVAHGLLHDGDPYGSDSIYGCWLIMRLCLIPLFRAKDQLTPIFEGV
jgi:hypothetical protein